MSARQVFEPEPLTSTHRIDEFDCGVESLNEYLQVRAAGDQAAGKSRTYVVVSDDDRVVGYFSVASAGIGPEQVTERVAKGQGSQPIPAVLIGRLAVASTEQGRGFGEALLIEALAKAAAAADVIGVRVVLAHALDARARDFYVNYGFQPSPYNDLHMMMLMKDIKKTLGIT